MSNKLTIINSEGDTLGECFGVSFERMSELKQKVNDGILATSDDGGYSRVSDMLTIAYNVGKTPTEGALMVFLMGVSNERNSEKHG